MLSGLNRGRSMVDRALNVFISHANVNILRSGAPHKKTGAATRPRFKNTRSIKICGDQSKSAAKAARTASEILAMCP